MRKFYSLLILLPLVFIRLNIDAQTPDSCRADFERLTTPNAYLTISLRALPWSNNNNKPEEICWSFGDNHDTCLNYDPSQTSDYIVYHTYSQPGNYTICVQIKYQGGCSSEKCTAVQVGLADSCRANFETVNSNTADSLGKYFAAQPWHNNNKKPVQVCWNFGDNHDTCIQYSTTFTGTYGVYHLYSQSGNYTVCVKILYDGGCSSDDCRLVQVGKSQDSCYADFEQIPEATANALSYVYYRALTTNKNGSKPSRICWSFGDGTDSCVSYSQDYSGGYVVSHHYLHSGTYNVCVDILYFGGCEAKTCRKVNIVLNNTDSCHVRIYALASSITSLKREFYFVSANTNSPARVCWSFGDGTDTCVTIDSNTTVIPYSIKHTYPAPGSYHVCVKVLFANNCAASDCTDIEINVLTDICGGYYTDSLTGARTYSFHGTSIHKHDDAVMSYRWTFGDGSSGTGESITHTYDKPGDYRVCLVINTEQKCETSICNSVSVAGTTPSLLQLTPNPVQSNLHVVFYSNRNETVTLRIVNSSGVIVKSYTRTVVTGSNSWDFDEGDLLTGIYSLSVQSPDQFASVIFFKQ